MLLRLSKIYFLSSIYLNKEDLWWLWIEGFLYVATLFLIGFFFFSVLPQFSNAKEIEIGCCQWRLDAGENSCAETPVLCNKTLPHCLLMAFSLEKAVMRCQVYVPVLLLTKFDPIRIGSDCDSRYPGNSRIYSYQNKKGSCLKFYITYHQQITKESFGSLFLSSI